MPTFQAVRPLSRSLSVSQGKGPTPMAAMVSALLEAVELDAAERLPIPPGEPAPPDAEERALWSDRPRPAMGVRLDPGRARRWVEGVEAATGRPARMPWDLLSLDTTRPAFPDAVRTSVGLATGGSRAEALAGAVAELLEHDLTARWEALTPRGRRAVELDLGTVDEPAVRPVLDRMARRGFAVRAWSIGQEACVPAFWCAIFPASGRSATIGPVAGSGCHASRTAALLRAVLEAAQSRAMLVAGARDDLGPQDYARAERRQLDLVLGTLSFGPGPLTWSRTPDLGRHGADANAALLLEAAARLSALPVLAYDHARPHPALHVIHAVAPGLSMSMREALNRRVPQPAAPAVVRGARPRPLVFVGPSLHPGDVPRGIELRPPALCGDMAALIHEPPPAVGLIDGCFELAPTVWHKELLELMARGVRVMGAASLGAIRAAELATLGMEGVGAVFLGYASGRIRRDDAVMLDHAPAELGYRPLTMSLVDAEAALLTVAIPPADRRLLQRIARVADYRERTWPLCLRRFAERAGRPAPVTAEELAARPSLKRRDALMLLARLLEPHTAGTRPPPPATPFHRRLLVTSRPAPPQARRESTRDGAAA